jgi:two-component system alkaline phosphatase synthesis response regulator PhoP
MPPTKILIVDDEPDIIEFLSYNLIKEGYDVISALDGTEGLGKAIQEKPDLIILDIMMPKMDGVELCRRLRLDSSFNDTLIAFLTAREEDYSQIAALEVGGDDYITKPLKPRVFISRIKALLRRSSKKSEENIIEVGNLKVDKDKICVYKNDKVIELAKKEFDLITLLMSKPGKVFSRDEIFRKIWGSDVIVGNRTIDVHIRKLREKIGSKYIKTIKGIGYKFDF